MKKLTVMALIACLAFSAAACGSSTEETTDTPAAEETADDAEAPAEEAPAEDAAEETADAETSGKTWVIAMDTVFRPFEFTNENGEFVGIDVDIINAVAEDQGFDIEIQSLGWDAAVAAVQAGQADALLAGASITEDRQASGWIFSDSYYDSSQIFTVKGDSDIASFEDLEGKTVAVKNATQGASFANSMMEEYGFKVDVYEDSPTMYQAVVLGQADACVEDKPIMIDSIKTGGLDLKVVEGMESEIAPYGMAIMNDANQELLDMFNTGLANIRENGVYDEIIATYLGE